MPDWAFIPLAAVLGALLGPFLDQLAQTLPEEEPRWSGAWVAGRALALRLAPPLFFALLAWRFGLTPRMAVAMLYAALFLLISAIDLEHRLVLNRVVVPAIALAPVTATLWGLSPWSIALGGIIEFGLYFLSALATRGGAVGGGDVKLAAYLGLITGYPRVLPGIFVTALAAGLVSAALLLLHIKSRHDYIPYAPYMLLGAAVALLLP